MNSLLIPSCGMFRLAPMSKLIRKNASVSFWKTSPFRSGESVENFCTLAAPDVRRLSETARITLTDKEVEKVSPKIQQVLDWFGQLQAVDLDSVAPAIRADTQGDNLRDDVPEIFANKEAIIAAIPTYEEPYIKVPKVLNKE